MSLCHSNELSWNYSFQNSLNYVAPLGKLCDTWKEQWSSSLYALRFLGVLDATAAHAPWGGFVNSLCDALWRRLLLHPPLSNLLLQFHIVLAQVNLQLHGEGHPLLSADRPCHWVAGGKKHMQVPVCPHSPLFTSSFSFWLASRLTYSEFRIRFLP